MPLDRAPPRPSTSRRHVPAVQGARTARRRTAAHRVVVLFDVDNTLLDNDAVNADLRRFLVRTLGERLNRAYWRHYEALRSEHGHADYLGAVQSLRREHLRDPRIASVSPFLLGYPFEKRV